MMKKVSKIFSLLLALVLILGLSATAFADGTATTGSITINNAVVGQTYTVYRILTCLMTIPLRPLPIR